MYDINHQVWAAHLLCRLDRGEEPAGNDERLGIVRKNVTSHHRKPLPVLCILPGSGDGNQGDYCTVETG